MGKNYKHLTWSDRLIIERLIRDPEYTPAKIAKVIGCCTKTVYNELKRGTYIHTLSDLTEEERYSPEKAQARYEYNLKAKGVDVKIGSDHKLAEYIENKIIKEKYSPQAVIYAIKNEGLQFNTEIKSVNTIYSYIRKGIFLHLSMKDLHVKKAKRKNRVQRQTKLIGTSIEKRPEEVLKREEFGHWEMDSVIGLVKNKKTLLVLTERKTRFEIVEVMKSHTTTEVKRALNRIEKRAGSDFYKVFKSITVDNGTEFCDFKGIEKALYRVGNRTKVYYCHPYCSCERGSNENQNRLVRYFYAKGTDFDKVLDKKDVKTMQAWINKYPRRIFGGGTAEERFKTECRKIGTKKI